MLDILAIVAIVIVLGVAAVLVYAATRPDNFRIQRTTSIKAPPDKIFPLIDDLHAHTSWSPFEKDPAMKRTHRGAPRGEGAVYEWEGNRQVGAGRIAI
ncbi:MAG: polyketide cyclase, partial [Xanthobacteraceae bacterium]